MRVHYKIYWKHEELGSGHTQANTYEQAMEFYAAFIEEGCNHVYVEMVIIGTVVEYNGTSGTDNKAPTKGRHIS